MRTWLRRQSTASSVQGHLTGVRRDGLERDIALQMDQGKLCQRRRDVLLDAEHGSNDHGGPIAAHGRRRNWAGVDRQLGVGQRVGVLEGDHCQVS